MNTSRDLSRVSMILACPYCGGNVSEVENGYACAQCQTCYPCTEHGCVDFRLQREKRLNIEFRLESPLTNGQAPEYAPLKANDQPEVIFPDPNDQWHLSPELLSFVPKARSEHAIGLDLGCGDRRHERVFGQAGYDYLGLDYFDSDAMILGDAHALPLQSNSVDFILSIAVLEHIRFPAVMMSEAYRVLAPGGRLIGSVSFLEPFHGDSYYHHTHLGVANTLSSAGFQIDQIAPNHRWTGLVAQANMGLFPKMPDPLSKAIVAPILGLHTAWWKIGHAVKPGNTDDSVRIRTNTGAFFFIATKAMT